MYRKIRQLIGLLNSMVNSGEQHSTTSQTLLSEVSNLLTMKENEQDTCDHINGLKWILNPEEGQAYITVYNRASEGFPESINMDWCHSFKHCPLCGALNKFPEDDQRLGEKVITPDYRKKNEEEGG
jgi:hypothetical protein